MEGYVGATPTFPRWKRGTFVDMLITREVACRTGNAPVLFALQASAHLSKPSAVERNPPVQTCTGYLRLSSAR
jgi:hypothetical protein